MGIKEIFVNKHKGTDRVEAAITESAVKSLSMRAIDSLSADSAADLLVASSEINKVTVPDITPVQAKIAIDQIRSWKEQKLVRAESADEAIAKLRPIAERAVAIASGERMFIEVVAQKAREEVLAAMDPKIQKEEELLLGQAPILTRAIYNAEVLNNLIAEGMWLGEYLSRRKQEIVFRKEEGLVGRVYAETISISYSDKGMVYRFYDGRRGKNEGGKITSSVLEAFYDLDSYLANEVVREVAKNKKRHLRAILDSIH